MWCKFVLCMHFNKALLNALTHIGRDQCNIPSHIQFWKMMEHIWCHIPWLGHLCEDAFFLANIFSSSKAHWSISICFYLGWRHVNFTCTIKCNYILLKLMIHINNHQRWLQYTFFDMALDRWNEVCEPHLGHACNFFVTQPTIMPSARKSCMHHIKIVLKVNWKAPL
jgi:hypothetical protein